MKPGTRSGVTALIILCTLTGIVLGVHSAIFRANESADERATKILVDSAEEQSATMAVSIEGQFMVLQSIKTSVVDKDPEEVSDFLAEIIENSAFDELAYIPANGTLYNEKGVVSVSDRKYFIDAMAGKKGIENIVSRRTNEKVIVLSIPCTLVNGENGVIAGIYAEEHLREVFVSHTYNNKGYSLLINSSGEIILNSESSEKIVKSANIFDFFMEADFAEGNSVETLSNALKAGKSASLNYSFNGDARIAAVVPFDDSVVSDNGWFVLNVVERDELAFEISSVRAGTLESMSIFALFSLAALFLFIVLERDHKKKNNKVTRLATDKAEELRKREEQFKIVVEQSERCFFSYDIATGTISQGKGMKNFLGGEGICEDYVERCVTAGVVCPESVEDYRAFFNKIKKGESPVEGDFLMRLPTGERRWYRHSSTLLFNERQIPENAIVSYFDYTEQREMEVAYIKWKQELEMLPDDEIALYEWNLTRDYLDSKRGRLVNNYSYLSHDTFDSRAEIFAGKRVFIDDRESFMKIVNREHLLGMYLGKKYFVSMEYRYLNDDGKIEWRKISIQLVSYPDSRDVKAYVVNQDINDEKLRKLELIERSERDGLTWTLNRTTFISRVRELLTSGADRQHVLIMIDLDGFKHVNDSLGHVVGDRVLAEYADYMRSALHISDLVGRVGGDEFMIFLNDIASIDSVIRKAERLLKLLCRRLNAQITVTVSMGISVFPRDGRSFEQLYGNADTALYHVKNSGKNHYSFYDEKMKTGANEVSQIDSYARPDIALSANKVTEQAEYTTILVVDDVYVNREIVRKALQNGYYRIIEATNGVEALKTLREDRNIDVMILDLAMPEMDGFEVLEKMRDDSDLKNIPVIVMTAFDDDESQAKAVSLGVVDFITKPCSAQIIYLRVGNTVDMLRNQRLLLDRMMLELRVKQQEEALRRTEEDSLTGLLNREVFLKRAEELVRKSAAGSYVISCFDINRFKVINDQYGIEAGDRLLKHMAAVFKSGFSEVGGFVGRISADNFIAVYPRSFMDTPEQDALWDKASTLDDPKLDVKLSIGRYIVTDLTLSGAAMQDRASLAKATAKGRYDRRCALFDESMREDVLRHQEIVDEMDTALAQKQFEIWLQPQYNHASGAMIGAEALVRWNHPTKGMILPSVFIPIFEENGFVCELDKYVWEAACKTLRRWLDEGRNPLPVAVNVSRFDIYQNGFYETVTGLVEKYNIPVKLLRLEITESAFSGSESQIIAMVIKLRDYGFVIEIDDFGSGYSSLNTLKDVPADILKLDMKFVEDDENSRRGGSILESIVRMAKWLNMPVVAEGVETLEQADFLKSIGCTYIQGYLYAKPMPVADYEKILDREDAECDIISLKKVVVLDSNAFWDPKSIETLIFNSYIGGAIVFEYSEGKTEILRVNDKYLEVHKEALRPDEFIKNGFGGMLDKHNREIMNEAIERAIACEEEVCYETERLTPGGERVFLRSRIRVIAKAVDMLLLYGTVEDITQRVNNERRINEITDQIVFLSDTAREIFMESNMDKAIEHALQRLFDYFGGSCAYVFEYNKAKRVAENTYLIGRSKGEKLEALPLDALTRWDEALVEKKYIAIENTRFLPDERIIEKRILEERGIGSLVVVPFHVGGDIGGFVGIDDPTCNIGHIDRLIAIGDYMSVLVARRNLNTRLLSDNETLRDLMRDMPGGFARMKVGADGTIVPVFVNDEFSRLLGMTHDEVMSSYGNDAYAAVCDEDLDNVRQTIEQAMRVKSVFSTTARFVGKSNEKIELQAFYRFSTNADGVGYINGYYADVAEKHKEELLRRDMLDHLPFGTGIYEVFDGKINLLYLNRRYHEMVGRGSEDYMNFNTLNAVHPDDREKAMRAIHKAFECGGDITSDFRIINGEGEYIPMHVVGNVVRRDDGRVFVYAAYTKLGETNWNLYKLLPCTLSAILDFSTDLVFIKNIDQTYICCTSAFAKMVGISDRSEIVGKTDYDIFEKELAEKYVADDRRIFGGEPSLTDFVETIPGENGEKRLCVTSKYLLYDNAGNAIGLYGVGRIVS